MSGKRVTVDVKRNDDGHIKTQYIVALPIILLNMNISLIMSEWMKLNLYQKLTYYVSGVLLAYAGLMRGLNISLNLIKLMRGLNISLNLIKLWECSE